MKAVTEVLRSGRLAQGDRVAAFEAAVAQSAGVGHAAAVSSGTAALFLSLKALGVGPGDEVIIPSYVCASLLQAVRHVGATPVVADIDDSLNLWATDAGRKATERTAAIIVPHLFGQPADVAGFRSLGVPIIEDCAQAIGATVEGRACGGFGDVAMFSFYATKMLATGEGGMVTSNRADLIAEVKDLRDYDEKPDDRLRYNLKMTDMAAAVGLSQLAKLPGFVGRRREIARRYDEAIGPLATGLYRGCRAEGHVFFRYVLDAGRPVGPLLDRGRAAGVSLRRPVFRPLHQLLKLTGFPRTDQAHERALSAPIYPALSDAEVDRIIDVVRLVLGDGRAPTTEPAPPAKGA